MSFYLNSSKNKDKVLEDMERISGYAWKRDPLNNHESVKLLIEDLKRLDQNLKETHFLLFSGVGYSGKANSCFFSSFDTPIADSFGLEYKSQDETKNKEFRERFIKYNESIKNYYSCLY